MCIWLAKRLLDDCSENVLYIGGGTGGHQGHMPSLGKDLPFSVPPSNCLVWWPFWPYPVAGTHAVDGSAIPEHGEQRCKNTRAQYSSGIESKYKFAYKYGLRSHLRVPNFKRFSGGACPRTPLVRACLRTHHHQCPPNRKYLPPPMLYIPLWWVLC